MEKQIIRSQPTLVGLVDMSLPGAVPISGSAQVAAGLGNPPTPGTGARGVRVYGEDSIVSSIVF